MNRARIRTYCYRCRHVQFFRQVGPAHRFHLILTILTAGVWLVSWISAIIAARFQPWRCQRCDWNLPRSVALSARVSNPGGSKSSSNRTTPPTAP